MGLDCFFVFDYVVFNPIDDHDDVYVGFDELKVNLS